MSDITYIETSQEWLYLTVIIDLFDRKVIGWAMSENMSAESTLIKAWYNRNRRHSVLNYKTIKEFELGIINHKYTG